LHEELDGPHGQEWKDNAGYGHAENVAEIRAEGDFDAFEDVLYFAARRVWKWSILRAGALCALLLAVEGAFLAANSAKVMQGGWLPLAIGAVVFLLMTTWKTGRYLLRKNVLQMLSLRDLIVSTTALGPESGLPVRVPGTAVFLAG
jgi:KUP system potassium uptake protein